MGFMGTLIIYLSACLCLYFLLILIKFFNKVWLAPIRIRSMMESQGIKGPSYRLLYGSSKEIINIRNEIMGAGPMELSDPVFPRVLPHIYSWIKLYGKNFLTWHGPQARLVVTEPELIKDVLNDKDGAYQKADTENYVKKLLGDGLVTTTRGAKWLKLRKVANHAFHSQGLNSMIPEMIASVEMMLERWRQHEVKEIEVFQEFKVLTSEIISRTAFGSSYLEGENIFDMLMKLALIVARNDHNIRIPGVGKFVKTYDDIESIKHEQGIRDSIMKMIKKREEETMMGKLENYGSDFLGLLVKAYHDEEIISVDDLIDECKTFYIAGHETTSSSLTWTILLLAIHTDWQEKARKEVLELFGQQNPNADSIGRLKTISMIVNESIRLYSPVIGVARKAKREVRLGKLIVPANIEVNIPILALHADPNIWGEDVHLFKPERFAEGIVKATNNNAAAFLPFGLGPRSCVGMNFAIAETKIALSMILQRYRFTLSPNYVHSPFQILTVCPQHGLPVMFQAL